MILRILNLSLECFIGHLGLIREVGNVYGKTYEGKTYHQLGEHAL